MEDKGTLKFSFCGGYEVNALSLSCAIASLVDISDAIAEREFPGVDFKMSVRAVQPGSLEFDFVASAIDAAKTLFTKDNIDFAMSLLSGVSAAFTIKQFLKDKKPKAVEDSEGKITIIRNDGEKIEIPKEARCYFIDNRIDQSVTNIIRAADASSGATGISIGPDVNIPREEFKACSSLIDFEKEEKTITTVREKETLFVRQADFSGELKWKFLGDQSITASVLDEDFQKNVKSGQIVISSKTYIIADVEVTVSLGPDGLPDESKPTYNILKVHSVHTAGEGQEKLNI